MRKGRYIPKHNQFNYISQDEEVIEQFELKMDELTTFFTDAETLKVKIRVSDVEARSVISGKHLNTLKELVNTISMESSNHSKHKNRHQMSIFSKILENSTTINMLFKNIKDYLQTLTKESFTWNKVWYGHYKEGAENIR